MKRKFCAAVFVSLFAIFALCSCTAGKGDLSENDGNEKFVGIAIYLECEGDTPKVFGDEFLSKTLSFDGENVKSRDDKVMFALCENFCEYENLTQSDLLTNTTLLLERVGEGEDLCLNFTFEIFAETTFAHAFVVFESDSGLIMKEVAKARVTVQRVGNEFYLGSEEIAINPSDLGISVCKIKVDFSLDLSSSPIDKS